MSERHVDVAVVGAGTAGLAAYRAAVAANKKVILIEGGVHGTTCARVGCMPSKLLIAAADSAHAARDADAFGVHATVTVDGRGVMTRVRGERDRFVGFVLESVEKIPDSQKLNGYARFTAPGTLDVADERVHAKSVVLATGSSPFLPPMFDEVRDRIVVNDDLFGWDDLPESVVVFGTGVIGLELGQSLHRLGVRTRIFGRAGSVGPLTDPVVVAAAKKAFENELPIDFSGDVKRIAARGERSVDVTFTDRNGQVVTETFAAILVAAGRKPNLKSLALENAGIDLDAPVDRTTLQWGSSSVFVAGDASDDVPLLHEAADEGAIAGANAAHFPNVTSGFRRSMLAVAFSDPQIALAGATWAELSARGPLVAGEVSFENQGRSRVIRKNHGALRVYADPKSGRFLGSEMAGPHVEHLAHLLAWSHQQGMTIDAMLAMPFYHPVIEEGLRTALRDASAKLKTVSQ